MAFAGLGGSTCHRSVKVIPFFVNLEPGFRGIAVSWGRMLANVVHGEIEQLVAGSTKCTIRRTRLHRDVRNMTTELAVLGMQMHHTTGSVGVYTGVRACMTANI